MTQDFDRIFQVGSCELECHAGIVWPKRSEMQVRPLGLLVGRRVKPFKNVTLVLSVETSEM